MFIPGEYVFNEASAYGIKPGRLMQHLLRDFKAEMRSYGLAAAKRALQESLDNYAVNMCVDSMTID